MKSSLRVIVLASWLVETATAQPTPWQVGFKAGVGLTGTWKTRDAFPAEYFPEQTETFRPQLGWLVGAKVDYRLSSHFSVVSGLEYQLMRDQFERGSKTPANQPYRRFFWAHYTAQRLQAPLLIRYSFRTRPRSMYVLGGVLPSYLLQLKAQVPPNQLEEGTYLVDLDLKANLYLPKKLSRFQVPFVVGLGLPMGRRLNLEGVYQYHPKPLEFVRTYQPLSPRNPFREHSWSYRTIFLSASYWLDKKS